MSIPDQIAVEQDNVLSVGVEDGQGRHFIWQRGLGVDTGLNDGVYFEFDDQINGGYNIARKVVVSGGGIEVTLSSGETVGIRYPHGFANHQALNSALQQIYQGREDVLEFGT